MGTLCFIDEQKCIWHNENNKRANLYLDKTTLYIRVYDRYFPIIFYDIILRRGESINYVIIFVWSLFCFTKLVDCILLAVNITWLLAIFVYFIVDLRSLVVNTALSTTDRLNSRHMVLYAPTIAYKCTRFHEGFQKMAFAWIFRVLRYIFQYITRVYI